ncbi:Arginine decarboxylase [Ananas comosus]|uniref:Arginine decarboxylase n=1 Tax=Ananas comosus TaxID=4615 RepID=A0A199V0A7_ANACO|nr:Arginine decarboxylase [Ananas comosus]
MLQSPSSWLRLRLDGSLPAPGRSRRRSDDRRRRRAPRPPWSPDLSAALYKIDAWGAPYFAVNSAGNIARRGAGLQLPLIVRLPDVLKNRLESLQSAFDFASPPTATPPTTRGLPVKCNQDRCVVEDVVQFGAPFRFGLEAGSKPELLLAMSCSSAAAPRPYSCATATRTRSTSPWRSWPGPWTSTPSSSSSRRRSSTSWWMPRAGSACAPSSPARQAPHQALGPLRATSGEKGKFGLTTTQILSVAAKLRRLQMLDCLQLLHFHIGSQIPSTALLATGQRGGADLLRACAVRSRDARDRRRRRARDRLRRLALERLRHVGGYGLEEYADAVVRAVRRACDQKGVRHPVLCSESGRALVSHHSVLVFEAVSATSPFAAAGAGLAWARARTTRGPALVQGGALGLEHLAAVDGLCDLVARETGAAEPVPAGVNGVLSDLTCDSDGKVDRFIGGRSSLPLHDMGGGISGANGERYYLGMFLGGAYQEALGGSHNLFGGPSVVRVSQSDGPHCFAVTRAVPGSSCADVLRAMQHEPELMFQALKSRAYEYYAHHAAAKDDDDSDAAAAAVTCAIARAFRLMPYLVCGRSAAADAMGRDGSDDGGEEGSGGVLAYGDEDGEWDFMRCLSV